MSSWQFTGHTKLNRIHQSCNKSSIMDVTCAGWNIIDCHLKRTVFARDAFVKQKTVLHSCFKLLSQSPKTARFCVNEVSFSNDTSVNETVNLISLSVSLALVLLIKVVNTHVLFNTDCSPFSADTAGVCIPLEDRGGAPASGGSVHSRPA